MFACLCCCVFLSLCYHCFKGPVWLQQQLRIFLSVSLSIQNASASHSLIRNCSVRLYEVLNQKRQRRTALDGDQKHWFKLCSKTLSGCLYRILWGYHVRTWLVLTITQNWTIMCNVLLLFSKNHLFTNGVSPVKAHQCRCWLQNWQISHFWRMLSSVVALQFVFWASSFAWFDQNPIYWLSAQLYNPIHCCSGGVALWI